MTTLRAGPQRGPVPLRQVRGVLQVQEGIRGPQPEPPRAQAVGGRWQAKDQEGDGGAEQGEFFNSLIFE